MFQNETLDSLTVNDWMAVGIVFCFGFLMLWYLFSAGSIRIGLWHAVFMAVASFFIGSALQEYTLLLDWIEVLDRDGFPDREVILMNGTVSEDDPQFRFLSLGECECVLSSGLSGLILYDESVLIID